MGQKIAIKTKEEIELMRKSGALVASILDRLAAIVRPGISTEELDRQIHEMTIAEGARPATLGYKGFPKSCCTSLNDVICHGIPNQHEILKAKDIIKIDVSCVLNGMYGDSCRTYYVGEESSYPDDVRSLVSVTYQALWAGVRTVKAGSYTGDIGAAIVEHVKQSGHQYGIVKDYTGHGLGRAFHEAPTIFHVASKGSGHRLAPGMVFTIEPMINLGTDKSIRSRADGWTVRTADGKLSAQWEHSVLVTEQGFEVLTLSKIEKQEQVVALS